MEKMSEKFIPRDMLKWYTHAFSSDELHYPMQ
jgi:hypothetical protein